MLKTNIWKVMRFGQILQYNIQYRPNNDIDNHH